MNTRKVLLFLVPLMFFLALRTQAEPLPEAEIQALLNRVQQTYSELEGFRAKFDQRLLNASNKSEELRQGRMAYKRPALVRWENESPEPETLIVGLDTVWDYFPGEDAVYIYPVSQVLESKAIVRLLSGQAKLAEEFEIFSAEEEGGLIKLSMAPIKAEPSLVEAQVWVDPADAIMRRILVFDFYFNENDVRLSELELSPELPDELFQFSPPVDVDVFDNRKEGAEQPAAVEEKTLNE